MVGISDLRYSSWTLRVCKHTMTPRLTRFGHQLTADEDNGLTVALQSTGSHESVPHIPRLAASSACWALELLSHFSPFKNNQQLSAFVTWRNLIFINWMSYKMETVAEYPFRERSNE